MACKGLWNICQKEDGERQRSAAKRRGSNQRIHGHARRALSSWLREDVEGKAAEMENVGREVKEEANVGRESVREKCEQGGCGL